MSEVALKTFTSGDLSIKVPEIWEAHTETYTEPDGRECSMIEISAVEGDPRSIIISYGPNDRMRSWKQVIHTKRPSARLALKWRMILSVNMISLVPQAMVSRFLQKTD